MKTLIYSASEELLDGFKVGSHWRLEGTNYTQSVDSRGYWLLIEDTTPGDNQTYELTQDEGLVHSSTGVEI